MSSSICEAGSDLDRCPAIIAMNYEGGQLAATVAVIGGPRVPLSNGIF